MAPLPPTRRSSSRLQSLQREIDDLFGDFFGTFDEEAEDLSRQWSPRMDLSETDEEYRLKMDLPGVSKDNLNLSAQNHRLRIQGEREEEAKEEEEDFLRVERSRGSFYRNVAFPDTADLERAEAEFENGTLTVHVPKREEQESTKISIS